MSKFQPPAKVENKSVTVKETTDSARSLIQRLAPEIRAALPQHLSPERVGRICLTEIRKNPKLLDCTQQSLAAAIIQSAQLGLELGSGLNLAWLIPSNNKQQDGSYAMEARFEMGYQGLMELARRSGKILSIDPHVVYADDEFEVTYGLDSKLHHKPVQRRKEKPADDSIIGAYAVAELPAPSGCNLRQWVWVERWEIDYIRSKSKQPNGPGWTLWFAAMCRKTAIKQLCKYLPKTAELARAIEVDDAADMGTQDLISDLTIDANVVNVTPDVPPEPSTKPQDAPKPSKQEKVKAEVEEQRNGLLARVTKHIESKRFTLQQVKDLAKCDNLSSLNVTDLAKVVDELDATVKSEGH